MSNQTVKRLRLDIFDGFRGHLLIGMLVAHLSFQNGLEWLNNLHHNRLILIYDAEFFVLIAGLLVGYLWTSAYNTSVLRRKFVTNRLATIYRYYILSALPFFVFSIVSGAPILKSIIGVLFMQLGGWYSDILPIYFVCFLIIFPFAIFQTLNRPVLMFMFSFFVYVASQVTDLNGFFGSSGEFVIFDIAAWQFLFICAILIGQHSMEAFKWIKDADARIAGIILLLLVSVSIFLRGSTFYPNPLAPIEVLTGVAARMGLHPLFLIKIVLISVAISIILIRNDLWFRPVHKIMHWYFGLTIIRNVGKYSIQMFVLHVYIMALYKVAFIDATDAAKAAFAVFWIVIFTAAPNIWVRIKPRFLNR